MWIEQCEPFAGRQVLGDEVEQERALSGAGLPDDVEVPPPFVGIEHDITARVMGADAELLLWWCHGRKGAGVPCAPQLGHDAGSTLFPLGCAGATWRRVIVR
jgi:hypothetical protein